MRIKLTSVFVKDQGEALKFYAEILGFVRKADITAGKYRWLTVVSSEDQDGTQLVLEPNENPAAKHIRKLFSSRVFAQHHSLWMMYKKSMND